MAAKLTYKRIATVGEEAANGNDAFKQLEQFVNEHIRDGWTPVGGGNCDILCSRPQDRWLDMR